MSLRIQRLVCRRRKTWNGQAKDGQELPGPRDAVWGLALSGGGIRSATFCFGLMQAFAIRKMLLRFDLLSTVSGGSYIGAMWGRLLQRAQSFDDVRRMSEALASSTTTWLSWWLRANGRYLMPRGTKDRLFALAVYLRNLLGIHAELGVIGLLLGTALAAFDLGVWSWLDTQSRTSWPPLLDAVGPQLGWLPTPWLLLIPLLAVGTLCIIVYWALPLVAKSMLNALIGMVLAALLIAVLWAIRTPWMGSAQSGNVLLREVLWSAAVFFSACWILALPIARVLEQRALCRHAGGGAPAPSLIRHLRAGTPGRYWSAQAGLARAFATAQAQDEARSRTTKWLYGTLYAAAAVLLLGTLDRFAWWLAFDMRTWLQTGLGLAVIAAALRALMPLMKLLTPGGAGAASLLWVGSVLGRLLTFCLSAWWVAVVQKTALGLAFEAEHIDLGAARNPLLLIGGLALAYALVTGWNNVRFLNLSSLHGFYRARLVRSYLGASNPDRFPAQAAHDPLNAVRPLPNDAEARNIKAVADVDPSDDLPIHEYKPHAHGGPIHLINACLNETRDPRGGLFNRDRRGRVVTIGPEGILRVSQQHWRALTASIESLTLGSWMAISGAAVAPGLGKATRGGIPALAMFTGARLGYWWDSTAIQGAKKVWRVPPVKLRGLLRETLGVFGGQEVRDWFMTDGGHFENTGAYALLVERCPLIVVADCGADPGYRFEDLENLVRKARIDLGAEITFLRPRTDKDGLPGPLANPMPKAALDLCSSFGSLNDLASPDNCACFALAAIDYAARAGQPQRGYLLLVKPNLCSGLPVDLVNFRAQHPAFPQQSTADQFFDEAQWESYFQLGKELGLLMSVPAIEALIAHADDCFVRDNGSPIEAGSQDGQATAGSAAAPGRIPARIATSAVKTSIGAGCGRDHGCGGVAGHRRDAQLARRGGQGGKGRAQGDDRRLGRAQDRGGRSGQEPGGRRHGRAPGGHPGAGLGHAVPRPGRRLVQPLAAGRGHPPRRPRCLQPLQRQQHALMRLAAEHVGPLRGRSARQLPDGRRHAGRDQRPWRDLHALLGL